MLMRLTDGETIADAEHRAVVILAAAAELTVTWSRYGAGEHGPTAHVHREHTDAFYVLTGEVTFEVGPDAEQVSAAAGTFVAVPPNVVHAFVNRSDAPATYLNMHAPDTGFAAYLRAAREGRQEPWDSFDPPADGGRAIADVVVSPPGEGVRYRTAELHVAEGEPGDGLRYELPNGRTLTVRASAIES
jgi:mannose-6-phosphate isomerase-like protein (cupin superfamily)